MHQATAPKLDVIPGGIHISLEPEPAHILDKHGEEFIPPAKSLMVRLDKAASERVEISKATMWAIGLVPVVLVLVLQYGAAALGLAGDYQSQKSAVQDVKSQQDEIRKDINKLNDKFDHIQEGLTAQAIKDAERKGYELGATDKGIGHAGKK